MITVKKVFEQADGKCVYQLYSDKVLGEVITKDNHILSHQVLDIKEKVFYNDFLLRSVVLLLSEKNEDVVIDYVDDYYLDLGFKKNGEKSMHALSKDIVFPSKCGKH